MYYFLTPIFLWCSLGYHTQTGNKDGFLSIDFGMKEWNEFDPKEIVRKYRQFVYETGAAESQESGVRGQGSVKRGIDPKIVEKAGRKATKYPGLTGSGTNVGILLTPG